MKNDLITDIRNIVGLESATGSLEDESTSLAVKLQNIIASDDGKQRQEIISAIEAFLKEDDTKKRKLLSF